MHKVLPQNKVDEFLIWSEEKKKKKKKKRKTLPLRIICAVCKKDQSHKTPTGQRFAGPTKTSLFITLPLTDLSV